MEENNTAMEATMDVNTPVEESQPTPLIDTSAHIHARVDDVEGQVSELQGRVKGIEVDLEKNIVCKELSPSNDVIGTTTTTTASPDLTEFM